MDTSSDHVGMFEAKTHFSEIVERVLSEGRPITITRRGRPVVDITPTRTEPSAQLSREQAVSELLKLREELTAMSAPEIVDLVNEGRNR